MTIHTTKHPVQYSFEQWITLSHGISHPSDEKRFFIFVKTVHAQNATRWKDCAFLKKKILDFNPEYDTDKLERIIQLYPTLLIFCKVKHQRNRWGSMD